MKPKYLKVVIGARNRPTVLVPEPRIEALKGYLQRRGVRVHVDFELADQVHSVAFLDVGKDEAAGLIRQWSELPFERRGE